MTRIRRRGKRKPNQIWSIPLVKAEPALRILVSMPARIFDKIIEHGVPYQLDYARQDGADHWLCVYTRIM